MSFWAVCKKKLRSVIPVSRTYMDSKLRELEKENKRQGKILQELQKNMQSLLGLQQYINQEFERRDDWGNGQQRSGVLPENARYGLSNVRRRRARSRCGGAITHTQLL